MSRTHLAAAVLLGIVVATWLLLQTNDGAGHSPQTTPAAGFGAVRGTGAGRVLLEAEDCIEIAPPMQRAVTPSFPERILAGASKGRAVYVGPEKWNDEWKQGRVQGDFKKGHPRASCPGYVRYRFRVPRTGEYVLWVRAWWVDDCGNSLEISIDGSRPVTLTGSTFGRWLWYELHDIENKPLRISLEQDREHVLTICNREDDLYFDQILFQVADLPVDPVGMLHPPGTSKAPASRRP